MDEDESPSFSERLHPQNLMEGDSLKLKCVVTGKPMPRIEWSKDGEVKITWLMFRPALT